MFDKLEISGKIILETGLHIGTLDGFSAIGAIDSYVIRDILTNEPMIPGSSIKGKMRSLLAKKFAINPTKIEVENEDIRVKRLFGTSKGKNDERPFASKLLFLDTFPSNKEELEEKGIDSLTEVKMENTINRITSEANPRSIERVIRGTEFDLKIIYELNNMDELEEDMKTLKDGFRLLEADYLGGNGSRGYGKIKIENLEVESLLFELDDEKLEKIQDILD